MKFSGPDLIVMWCNSAMAATAAIVNLLVAVDHPDRNRRIMRQSIGILAIAYAAGYASLALGLVPLVKWSQFFRFFSLFAWPAVWILPAVADRRRNHLERRFASKLIEVAAQERAA